jgi:hypothetical protein
MKPMMMQSTVTVVESRSVPERYFATIKCCQRIVDPPNCAGRLINRPAGDTSNRPLIPSRYGREGGDRRVKGEEGRQGAQQPFSTACPVLGTPLDTPLGQSSQSRANPLYFLGAGQAACRNANGAQKWAAHEPALTACVAARAFGLAFRVFRISSCVCFCTASDYKHGAVVIQSRIRYSDVARQPYLDDAGDGGERRAGPTVATILKIFWSTHLWTETLRTTAVSLELVYAATFAPIAGIFLFAISSALIEINTVLQ